MRTVTISSSDRRTRSSGSSTCPVHRRREQLERRTACPLHHGRTAERMRTQRRARQTVKHAPLPATGRQHARGGALTHHSTHGRSTLHGPVPCRDSLPNKRRARQCGFRHTTPQLPGVRLAKRYSTMHTQPPPPPLAARPRTTLQATRTFAASMMKGPVGECQIIPIFGGSGASYYELVHVLVSKLGNY